MHPPYGSTFYKYLLGTAFVVAVGCSFSAGANAQSSAQSSDKASSQDQSANSDKSSDSAKKDDSDKKDDGEAPTVRLKIEITDPHDKPVGNASVYIRFNQVGGPLHKDKLAELNLKTNDDGTVKVPEIPQGKIMIQVVAKGLHTFGKWYDINKSEDTIEIKLENPPHWY